MGNNRPVDTKIWVAFLLAHGCKYIRTKASHDHYRCPNCFRTITHREKDKQVPAMHLRTNLRTMGKTLKYLYVWIEDYNRKRKAKNK
jgi:predicted RNA binding protein YcfA (HicA-like mRNA interferase family)